MDKCTADGTSWNVCSAKYTMMRLKDKHEQAKKLNDDLGLEVKNRWT